jgi:hypothetical protein
VQVLLLTFGEADEQLRLTRADLKSLTLEHLSALWKVSLQAGTPKQSMHGLIQSILAQEDGCMLWCAQPYKAKQE